MLRLLAAMFLILDNGFAAYIFFKGDAANSHPLSIEEFQKTQEVLTTTEFTHLMNKQQENRLSTEEEQTLTLHFQDHKAPFYEEALIQEKLKNTGISVRFVPDTIAQFILIKHAQEHYLTDDGKLKPGINQSSDAFKNDLNSVVLSTLKKYKFFANLAVDAKAIALNDLFAKYLVDFKRVIDENFSPSLFMGVGTAEDIKKTLSEMVKVELLSQYESALLLVRSTNPFEKEGEMLFDDVYDKYGRTYGLSYNYSLFAAYFFDHGASTFRLSVKIPYQVLYTLLVPKTKSYLKQFDLFYLPKHSHLKVVFEYKNDVFHPRTVGRVSAGTPVNHVIRDQTPVTLHDVHMKALIEAYKKGLYPDKTLFTNKEAKIYKKTPSIGVKRILENRVTRHSPSKTVHYAKDEQFKNIMKIDLSKLSTEEQAEYQKLKSKIALTGEEQRLLQDFGFKARSKHLGEPFTPDEMRRILDPTVLPIPDASSGNDNHIAVPLLKLLAHNTIIVSINSKPIDAEMTLPTKYHDGFANLLTQNHKELYERTLKLSKQLSYVHNLDQTGRSNDEVILADSPAAYKEGRITAIDMQIKNIDAVLKRMDQGLHESQKKHEAMLDAYRIEYRSLANEKMDLMRAKADLER